MIKEISDKQKPAFNKLAVHPMQSYEWGEFRLKTGIEIIRLGRFINNRLAETAQLTVHPIPFTSYRIGYFPKGGIPSQEMLQELKSLGREKNMIFIKMEPNIINNSKIKHQLAKMGISQSPHPLFTKYTFRLDLTDSEETLLKNMHHKTRYNIKLSQKKGVSIQEDDSARAFSAYLKLLQETTRRQKFYAHTPAYHSHMWDTLKPGKIARLLLAKYKHEGRDKILAAWIIFIFNDTAYYPYGASSTEHRNLMASNLMMWEAIRLAKREGARVFDMWGALSPAALPDDPWYGFHKFKEGYAGELTELLGSYDLIINRPAYNLYNLMHRAREWYLKLKR